MYVHEMLVTQFHKTNTNEHKGQTSPGPIRVDDFNASLPLIH
jgi:hypothetical protein